MTQTNGSSSKNQATKSAAIGADDRLASTSGQTERILVTCPSCKTALSVRRKYMGDEVRCKRCDQKFLVPAKIGTRPIPIFDGSSDASPSRSKQAGANSHTHPADATPRSLMDQLSQFVASQDELRSAHHRLQVEHNGVRDERDSIRETLKNARNELTAIRDALGTIAPEDVSSLASEREALGAEVRSLRNIQQTLLSAIRDREAAITRFEMRVGELAHFQGECDSIAERMKARELELAAVRAEGDYLRKNLAEERTALVVANSELAQLRHQLTQSKKEMNIARDECRQARDQLELYKTNLGSVQAALARLSDEQRSASATIEGLTNTVADRDHTIAIERDQFSAEFDSSRKALRCAERSHHDKLDTLKSELTTLRAEHDGLREEHRAAELLRADLQARNHELIARQELLEAEYHERLEREGVERKKLSEELSSVRAQHEETARVAEEWISAVLGVPTVPVASAEELETAQVGGEGLRYDNAKSDRHSDVMPETHGSVGIHVSFS